MNPNFWRGKSVLVSGHNGFKGSWLTLLLTKLGANVSGVSLAANKGELWDSYNGRAGISEFTIDIAEDTSLNNVVDEANAEIIIHMAAQAEVKRGYMDPVGTHRSNILGTINLLDKLRFQESCKLALIVTTDKVYANKSNGSIFSEGDPLGGSDPYSASKAATEIIVQSYVESFFDQGDMSVLTARAGNVVGGGDFSEFRLVPDIYRSMLSQNRIQLRNPDARRPWQHVLDCLSGYLTYIECVVKAEGDVPVSLNFGPDIGSDITVSQLTDAFLKKFGIEELWEKSDGHHEPEKQFLMLDNSAAKSSLGWEPKLDLEETIDWTVNWYAAFASGKDPYLLVQDQIDLYLG